MEKMKRKNTHRDDPDETEGRALYRALAENTVRVQHAVASWRIRYVPAAYSPHPDNGKG